MQGEKLKENVIRTSEIVNFTENVEWGTSPYFQCSLQLHSQHFKIRLPLFKMAFNFAMSYRKTYKEFLELSEPRLKSYHSVSVYHSDTKNKRFKIARKTQTCQELQSLPLSWKISTEFYNCINITLISIIQSFL